MWEELVTDFVQEYWSEYLSWYRQKRNTPIVSAVLKASLAYVVGVWLITTTDHTEATANHNDPQSDHNWATSWPEHITTDHNDREDDMKDKQTAKSTATVKQTNGDVDGQDQDCW